MFYLAFKGHFCWFIIACLWADLDEWMNDTGSTTFRSIINSLRFIYDRHEDSPSLHNTSITNNDVEYFLLVDYTF